jgi:hypothetical protein
MQGLTLSISKETIKKEKEINQDCPYLSLLAVTPTGTKIELYSQLFHPGLKI